MAVIFPAPPRAARCFATISSTVCALAITGTRLATARPIHRPCAMLFLPPTGTMFDPDWTMGGRAPGRS